MLVAIVASIVVIAVVWDVFSDATEAPAPVAAAAPETVAPPPQPPPHEGRSQAGSAAPVDTVAAAPPVPDAAQPGYMDMLARAETRRQIRESARYTYLNDILANSPDSMLHRWDNRIHSPVRVHLAPSRVANYQPAFLDAVRAAFRSWEASDVPVRFDLSADSTDAEVTLKWRLQFEIDRTGQTDLTWDGEGHHQSGVVTLATFNQIGQPMSAEEIRIVAMHEVGHLLGLDHSPDSTDLMYPVARVRELSSRDIASARLLYRLSPGSIR
jgi:predicted Zn-dependent protease